jgi:transcription elongation factor Elf1
VTETIVRCDRCKRVIDSCAVWGRNLTVEKMVIKRYDFCGSCADWFDAAIDEVTNGVENYEVPQ